MKKFINLILALIFLIPSLEQEFYPVEDVFTYLDSQGLEDFEYQEILSNLSLIFKNSYAFYDIAKNPPQPDFDENYHSSVDIGKRFSEIDTTDINFYEFYRRITDALADLRDPHIQFSFTDWEFPEFLVTVPFEYVIAPDSEDRPKIFVNCLENEILMEFEYGMDIIDKCSDLAEIPVKSINGLDPFEYITNFGGHFTSSKNNHATFSYKINYHNYVPLSEFNIDIKDENSYSLEVVFDNDEIITTKYLLSSEIEIRDNNNFLRALSRGRGFYLRNFYLNNNDKQSHQTDNFKEEIIKRKNKNLNGKKIIENKLNLKGIGYSYKDGDGVEIFKCFIEEDLNFYYVSSFAPEDRQRYVNVIQECVNLFDENNNPIVVINELNNGGYTSLSQLFMGVLSPLMPIYLFKGRIRITDAIQETEEIIHFINSNLTNVNTCKNMSFEDLIEGQVNVNYSDTNLSEIFYLNNITIHNKIEEMRLNMINKRKPTEILVLTDGYSFSAAALYIKYLQKMGGAIVAGYYGNPYSNEVFDSAQSPSAIFSSEILNILNPKEYKYIEDNYTFQFQLTGMQTFFDLDDKNIPLEYEVTPIDERIDVYELYDEKNIDQYLEIAKEIFNKYQDNNCNKKNKKLLKISEECDGNFLNEFTHGGYICADDGTWSNECVPSYCENGYIFDKNQNKCIKDICSSIHSHDEEEEEEEETKKEEETEENEEEKKEEEEHKEEEQKEEEQKEEEEGHKDEEEEQKEEEHKEEEEEHKEKEEEHKEEEEEQKEKEEEQKEEEEHKEEEEKQNEEEEKHKEEEKGKENEEEKSEEEEENKKHEEEINEEENGSDGKDESSSNSSDDIYIVILSVIVGIIFIISICLIVHYCRKRSKNNIEINNEINKIDSLLIEK